MPFRAATSAAVATPVCGGRRYLLPLNPHHISTTVTAPILLRNQLTVPSKRQFVGVSRAVDSSQPSAGTAAGAGDKAIVPDDQFSLSKECGLLEFKLAASRSTRLCYYIKEKAEATDEGLGMVSYSNIMELLLIFQVSIGAVGLGSGITLLVYGFGAYFNVLPGSEWSALMLTYGFPVAVIGFALKYAELKPVPCITYSDAQMLREKCATPVLKQVRSDVTRFRYGDEQHLDEALKRIFQYGLGGGIPRRSAPILKMIREEVTEDSRYCLTLVFEAKALQLSDFERRQAKFASFFGPGITAEVGKGENDMYEVRLVSNTEP